MDVPQSRFSDGGLQASVPEADPRLQPTPDYGSLGPGSDIGPSGAAKPPGSGQQAAAQRRVLSALAVGIGILGALIAGAVRSLPRTPSRPSSVSPERQYTPATPQDIGRLDQMKPQRQAEVLLELAVTNNPDAVDQISSRVDGWHGRLQWTPQIASLSTTALNSSDMRVRASGVEVELAAYGLGKKPSYLDYLFRSAESPDHQQKIWALWALGLMANRGIGSDHVVYVLTSHLKDTDEDSRHWAVESLALTGSSEAIGSLLRTMHDDPSALVRERAACGLAESGMFTHEQRMTAVPELISYLNDPALDNQTHAWASQALSDISHQHFGTDAEAWQNWYNSAKD